MSNLSRNFSRQDSFTIQARIGESPQPVDVATVTFVGVRVDSARANQNKDNLFITLRIRSPTCHTISPINLVITFQDSLDNKIIDIDAVFDVKCDMNEIEYSQLTTSNRGTLDEAAKFFCVVQGGRWEEEE
jgi:hypothetical protein